MKKSIIFMFAAAGLMTACDPNIDDISMPEGTDLTSEQLAEGFTVVQYADEEYTTPSETGNYFTFFTSPSRVVEIYQLDEEGAKNVLAAGLPNGKFKIVPKRGNPSNQTYYVRTMEFDGTEIIAQKSANVYVPTELTPEMRLLASDAYGKKIWKWDTSFRADGGAWGNFGYASGDGSTWYNGVWFSCPPADLTGQLQHSNTGVATGEEHPDAYMEFYDDGNLITYDAAGNQIRKGKYSVEGYTGERNHPTVDGSQQNWSFGTFKTTAGSILWPFKINGGGEQPTDFELVQLDENHLQLTYAAAGTGGWGEATWWAFKSVSDAEASLTGFGTKEWTWDTEFRDGAVWGNMGYAPGDGDSFVNSQNGIWWGCDPETLATPDQIKHSDTGKPIGEEDRNAYMTFDWKTGAVKSYAADGTEIRSGKFEIKNWGMGERTQATVDGSQAAWAMGTLNTTAGSILFPFKINGGGEKPTDFEIMQLDRDHLKLIYAAPGTGGWGEATWWAFKKK